MIDADTTQAATSGGIALPGMPPTNPAATPTTLPSPDAKFKQILGALIANAQRKQAGGTPVPGQVDPQQSMAGPMSIGMNTKNPRAWGSVRFMAGLQTQIANAVSKKKQNDILKAEGDWTYMQSALNELYAAQQSGDQQAMQAAQNKVDSVFGDQKKLKNMAKALNQDWLNPEKTTVYGEALKKVNAETQAKDAKQMQAAQGIKGLFQRLIQRRQQPQLSPDQQRAMAREIEAKAPVTTGGVDKGELDILKEQMREESAARLAQQKEDAAFKSQQEKEDFEQRMTEIKNDATERRDRMNNAVKASIEESKAKVAVDIQNMRDIAMLKREGMILSEQDKKLFKADQTKIDGSVKQVLTGLRQGAAQAQSNYKMLEGKANDKYFGNWRMSGELKAAKEQADNFQAAVAYLDSKQEAIKSGKLDFEEATTKAHNIAMGIDIDESDFKPDKPNAQR